MITDVNEIKQQFTIETEAHDHILAGLLLKAVETAKKHIDGPIEAEEFTEYYDGDGTCELLLRKAPVVEIDSIHDALDRDYDADALVDADDYTFETYGKVTLDAAAFQIGKQNVKVVYTAGFVTVPYDLKLAVQNLTMADYVEANAGVNAVQGQDFVYRPKKLRDEAYATLDRYRKVA